MMESVDERKGIGVVTQTTTDFFHQCTVKIQQLVLSTPPEAEFDVSCCDYIFGSFVSRDNVEYSKRSSLPEENSTLFVELLIYAKTHAELILSTLIQWRKQQQITLASTLSIDSSSSKQKSLTSKKPLELLYDERKYDAIEFVFYKVSCHILKHCKSAISSTIYDTLDSLIIDYLKLNAKSIIVYKKGFHSNKKIVEENISELIGEMSYYRLPFIASKYFAEISTKSDFVNTNICIIESIRSIQLSTNNVESLKDLMSFVEYILHNWKTLRGKKEQKHIFADVLANIFRPLIDKTTSLFDTSPLLIHFGKLYKLASSISKKSYGPSVYLMAVCLSLSDTFEENFWKTLENFTKQVDLHSSSGTSSTSSSGNTSSYIMDSIYSIIVGYFNKISKDNDKVITTVSNYLKQKLIEFECLDIVIDIIHLMSTIRFGYVIENVIFDFIGSIEQSNRVICGVLSWMRIVGRLYQSDSTSMEDVLSLKSNIITFVSKKKISPLKRRLSSIKLNKESRTASLILRTKLSGVPATNTLNDSKDINELQSIYLPRMSTLISNLVHILDTNLGDYVSYNNNPSLKKELEMKDKEKLCHIAQTVIHMIMHTIVHLPILNTSNFRLLIQSVLKFSYHVHEGIYIHASDLISVLSVLPDFRPILINEYTNFLFRLPNEYNYLPLKRLNDLLWQWKLSSIADGKLFDPNPLEAVLLTMSCIDKETRVTCIQLLGMISDIIPSFKTNPSLSNRLYDFLLYTYSLHNSTAPNTTPTNSTTLDVKNNVDDDLDAFYSTNMSVSTSSTSTTSSTTAETLLNSLYKEEEVNYCIIVSKMMQSIKKITSSNNTKLLLCKMVFQTAYHRIIQITQTNQIDKNNINLFRNLLILCNATALDLNVDFTPFPDVSLDSYCKDIIAFYMKQDDILPLIQLGLPYLHHSVSPLILAYIDGFNEVKIKKKSTIRQQNNTIMMVHSIIDSFPDGLLIKDHFDTILTKALLYIQRETEYYLDSDLNSTQLSIDEISARLGLAQIISKILLDINIAKFKHDILSQNFRSKILKFLESCCSLNSSDLQLYAMSALAQLVGNVYFHEYSFAEEKDSILTIINNFFHNKTFYDVTKLALQNYLTFDHGPIQECVVECYSSNTYISQGYFLTLLDFIISNNKSTLVLSLPTLLHLVIYIVGHPSLICRENGSILVSHLSNKSILKSNLRVSSFVLSEEEYCTQQYILSYKLATLYPELTKDIIIEWITRFKQVESIALKNQMLNYISGWINNLILDQILRLDKDLLWFIIEQLLIITHFYGSSLQYSVNNLWTILVKKHEDNVSIILDIILYHLSHKINKELFQLAKKIIVVVYRANSNKVISILFHDIYHKCAGYSDNSSNINNSTTSSVITDNSSKTQHDNWSIEDIFKSSNSSIRLSKSQVSMILLVDLILEREIDLLTYLPKLTHISILYIDSPMPIIHKHSKQLLNNILFKLQAKTKNTSKLDKLCDKLASLTAPGIDIKSIVDDLIDTIPMNNLLSLWIQEAVSWLSNSSHEFVQQSIKIYHSLFLKTHNIDKRSILLLLNSLTHFLKKRVDASDTSFTIEFIELIQSILITVEIDVILSFPQLIHTLCYMLFSTNQKEFAATCNALSKGISRIGHSISGLLLQNIHESNNISYSNILACILKGLSREYTYNITIQLLQEFLSFEKLDLDTLFILLIGLVPYIITNDVSPELNKLVNLFLKVLQKKVSNYKDLKIGSGTANSIQSKLTSYSELLGSWYFNEHSNADVKQVVIEDLSHLFDLIFFPSYSRISYMYLFEVLQFNSNKTLQKIILSLLTEFVKNESVIRIEKGNVYHKLYLILKEHVVTSPLSKEWIYLLELVLTKCNSTKKEANEVDTKHLQHFDVEKWWTPSETMRKYLVSNLTRVASTLQEHEDDPQLVKK